MRKEDWFEEGMACLGHKDFAGAERAFQQAIRLDPRDGAPWAMLGLARANSGNRAGAIEAYRRALTFLPRCDLARETREKLTELTRQDLATTAPGGGPAPPAAKKIPKKVLPRTTELTGVTWRPRAGRQLTYLVVMGGFIIEVLAGVADILGNMAFWAEFYARVGRTYSNDTDYLLISLYVILAVVGIAAIIGKMTSSLRIDRDGITWRPWYFPHHYPWSEVESIADERQPIVHIYRTAKPMILVQVRREKPLQIRAYRFRDPVDPKTGKVQKIEHVLRTYWEAFKQRVTEIPLEKNE